MSVKKVDVENQGWTYSSYVKAGDFIFTSICSGFGDTIKEATETAQAAKQAAGQAAAMAEEAIRKAEEAKEAAVRKVLASWEFITIIVIIILGSVIGAVAISLGLGLSMIR